MIPEVVIVSLMDLFNREILLATELEILKQKLALCYDFDANALYSAIDDCNIKFIDAQSIKRFLAKCKLYPCEGTILSLIRRLDLDSDARLNKKEFIDGILPQENYSKGSVASLKNHKVKIPFI